MAWDPAKKEQKRRDEMKTKKRKLEIVLDSGDEGVYHTRSDKIMMEVKKGHVKPRDKTGLTLKSSNNVENLFRILAFYAVHVKSRVLNALGRGDRDWRLSNTCPACEYHLEGEDKLKFSMMFCMDGNDSLKRMGRKSDGIDEEGIPIPNSGPSKERIDGRVGGGNFFLSNEEVNWFAMATEKGLLETLTEEDTPCMPRWKNMDEKATASMWGIFEETGIFLSLCRHGAKYALAIIDRLMDVLGERLGGGYDIGCGFKTTISRSPLASKAEKLEYTSLVGTFHGHAHCRLCQIDHLGTYVEGNGLEDSEGCERFFSKSNALASSIRHASKFHRRQAIAAFAEHNDDFEAYSNLIKFLRNNYIQALEICGDYRYLLEEMRQMGITSTDRFKEWLAEEKAYLQGLQKQPEKETVQMEYYQALVELDKAEKIHKEFTTHWLVAENPSIGNYSAAITQKLETQRRHAAENYKDLKEQCQVLERKLEVKTRWSPGSKEWEDTKTIVERQRYQKCIDRLEGLIVARLFELTRMNKSQTGYKMRKHIGKALQSRSQAVRTALTNYNDAAAALDPPGLQLDWESVMECTFLADFDVLRDVRQDVRDKEWADPRKRSAMDRYFKICRAREEIKRLNIEIRRVATYLRDEDEYLHRKEKELADADPNLARQIQAYRLRRGRFNTMHWKQLREIAKLDGFTGTLEPGIGKLTTPRPSGAATADSRDPAIPPDSDEDDEDSDEEQVNDDYEDVEQIMKVTNDVHPVIA
ncbi:hypothetical protein K435DRAFT_794455 [Dendrothele bispora CBS 962.96]|uniref:CxC2-like cysteine cluster KDZ transposase-associated domain-containing protein n=1 Tax=Dendrothele bispora (strain CBS 962.96) TaxID=1314807 RepID=A0A4S8MBY2_DENBC|nr:hypothetical protein K435DRAFT_794455 [Dendrothele bispora CBS 962.96]